MVTVADPALLSYDERMRLLADIEVESSRLAALRARTLAAIEADDTTAKRWAREEAALAMRVAACTATGYAKEAEHLVTRLPRTLAALESGAVSTGQARVLTEATFVLDPEVAAAVEERALAKVEAGFGGTVGLFRAVVRRVIASLDPRTFESRHAGAVADRRVEFHDRPDGIVDVHALSLPADAAALVRDALDRRARSTRLLPDGPRDPRTADQRRADALVDLLAWPSSISPGTGTGRSGPAIQVVVSASTLLGLDDLPADLDGHGPIPAGLARTFAEDPSGTWRRILTDPAGAPLEVSRAYTPPAAVCRFVAVRDRRCRFPNCRRRAAACETDHVHDHHLGGPTVEANLHDLCPRHHHLKHEAPGWRVRRLPDGTTRWRTPGGRVVDVPPEHYDTSHEWSPPVTDDAELDAVAPLGGFHPDAPLPLDVPPDVDDRWAADIGAYAEHDAA